MNEIEETGVSQFIDTITTSNDIFRANEVKRFLLQLHREIHKEYGLDMDWSRTFNIAMHLLETVDGFSEHHMYLATKFYEQSLSNSQRTLYWWGKKKKQKQPELVLGDNMTIGLACIMGGALLSIVPSGVSQGIGAGLITTGLTFVLESVKKKEEWYYIDPQTGQRINPPK